MHMYGLYSVSQGWSTSTLWVQFDGSLGRGGAVAACRGMTLVKLVAKEQWSGQTRGDNQILFSM